MRENSLWKSAALRTVAADILSVNSFFFAVNLFHETLVAGIPFAISLRARFIAVITNSITARPYGLWQDFIRLKVCMEDGRVPAKVYLADTTAFISFQLPLYWFNLIVAGQRNVPEALVASITVVLMASFLGRPCGIWMDFVRRILGIAAREQDDDVS